jgi:hypothetical protein
VTRRSRDAHSPKACASPRSPSSPRRRRHATHREQSADAGGGRRGAINGDMDLADRRLRRGTGGADATNGQRACSWPSPAGFASLGPLAAGLGIRRWAESAGPPRLRRGRPSPARRPSPPNRVDQVGRSGSVPAARPAGDVWWRRQRHRYRARTDTVVGCHHCRHRRETPAGSVKTSHESAQRRFDQCLRGPPGDQLSAST